MRDDPRGKNMNEEIRKKYRVWDFDEEEKWVNQMAQKGQGLTKAEGSTYWFSPEEPGAYRYRLLFLKKNASSDRGMYEIALEEENGWELVGSRGKRAWLKRPASDIGIDLLSDVGNKRRLLKRMRSGLILVCAVLFVTAFYELFTGMVGGHSAATYIGLAEILIGMFFLALVIQISGTLKMLKNQIDRKKGRY